MFMIGIKSARFYLTDIGKFVEANGWKAKLLQLSNIPGQEKRIRCLLSYTITMLNKINTINGV